MGPTLFLFDKRDTQTDRARRCSYMTQDPFFTFIRLRELNILSGGDVSLSNFA